MAINWNDITNYLSYFLNNPSRSISGWFGVSPNRVTSPAVTPRDKKVMLYNRRQDFNKTDTKPLIDSFRKYRDNGMTSLAKEAQKELKNRPLGLRAQMEVNKNLRPQSTQPAPTPKPISKVDNNVPSEIAMKTMPESINLLPSIKKPVPQPQPKPIDITTLPSFPKMEAQVKPRVNNDLEWKRNALLDVYGNTGLKSLNDDAYVQRKWNAAMRGQRAQALRQNYMRQKGNYKMASDYTVKEARGGGDSMRSRPGVGRPRVNKAWFGRKPVQPAPAPQPNPDILKQDADTQQALKQREQQWAGGVREENSRPLGPSHDINMQKVIDRMRGKSPMPPVNPNESAKDILTAPGAKLNPAPFDSLPSTPLKKPVTAVNPEDTRRMRQEQYNRGKAKEVDPTMGPFPYTPAEPIPKWKLAPENDPVRQAVWKKIREQVDRENAAKQQMAGTTAPFSYTPSKPIPLWKPAPTQLVGNRRKFQAR